MLVRSCVVLFSATGHFCLPELLVSEIEWYLEHLLTTYRNSRRYLLTLGESDAPGPVDTNVRSHVDLGSALVLKARRCGRRSTPNSDRNTAWTQAQRFKNPSKLGRR